DGDGNAGGFEVLELGAYVVVIVLGEGNVAGGGELESGGVVSGGLRGDLIQRRHRQVDGLQIEEGRLELVHEVDEVCGIEAAEGVAGDAETDGQVGVGSGGLECGGCVGGAGCGALRVDVSGQKGGCSGERTGAHEGAASEVIG